MTWDGNAIDPWLPDRLAAEARITAAERRLHDAWFASISRWLVKTKRGVFANGPSPDPTAVFTTAPDWAQEMDRFVQGPVKDTMGIAYRDLFGDGYDFDARPAVSAHLADVHNRMVRTTDDVFSLVAGEVAHGAAAGESVDDIAARVGQVLDATGTERWPNRAVTVARTETVGALNAGRTDSFAAVADELGEPMEQMWLSTIDARTRPAHAAADGQRVPVGQPFTVGGSELKYPGDPSGPAAAVINCRCSTLLVKPGEEVDLTNRQYTADDWDAWHDAQQQQTADTGQPVEDPPPRDLETEARQRQARIDGARTSGAAAAELDEIVTSGASAKAVEHRIAAQVARGTLPPDVADEMRTALAAGDMDEVRAIGWRHAGKQGAVRVGAAGDVVPFDRRLHEAIDDDLRPGQQVIVVRPGTRWADEDRLLAKASVDVADDSQVLKARFASAATERAAFRSAPRRLGSRDRPLTVDGDPAGWDLKARQEAFDVLDDYKGPYYVALNAHLRGEYPSWATADWVAGQKKLRLNLTKAEAARRVKIMDGVMEQSKLAEDVILWRGSRVEKSVFGDRYDGNLTGFEWLEQGFMSTSADEAVARKFAELGDDPGVLVRIFVRRGTGAVGLEQLDRYGEAEVLLQRGLRLRVVQDYGMVQPPRVVGAMFRPQASRLLDAEVVIA